MKLIRLKNLSNSRTKRLTNILNNLNLENIFNPSYTEFKNHQYLLFRANSKIKYTLIESYIIILDKDYKVIIYSNLSKLYFERYGIKKVNDPKICILNNLICFTFNTGTNRDGNNIYLAEINKDMPKPKKCIYKKRMLIEKNWGFYNFKEKLFALYSLYPLVILVAYSIESDQIEFKTYSEQKTTNTFFKGLTIGTNLEKINDQYWLMAHEKKFFNKKRIYFGRLICLKLKDKKFKLSKIYPNRYIHSFRSLLGTIKKRNKNLISCTYFSGFYYKKKENLIILSYGINDFNFAFASIPLKSII